MGNLDLAIEDGELMVLVGPSGCGKTTALRMVAGLEEITDGELRIGDRIVNDLTPKERNIAMVFQSYALYPHMTVEDNLAFSLKLAKVPKKEVDERVQRAANILQIEEYLKRKPRALSGGQRQRVAMGRAIVREPEAFLMDEPLSNLDAKLRVQMRAEIQQLQRRLDVTTMYVTHDQVEAMTMGDRVAVMSAGRLLQVDTPQVLYDKPVNEFVAGFIGSPSINLVEAKLEQSNGHLAVVFGDHRLTVDDPLVRNRPALSDYVGQAHSPRDPARGLRGREHRVGRSRGSPPEGHVQPNGAARFGGARPLQHRRHARRLERRRRRCRRGRGRPPRVAVTMRRDTTRLVARVSPRTRIAEGSTIELAVDTSRLYFFDPETGGAV